MLSFRQPIRMQYVANFTSMQYMSTSVNTGAEGMLSIIVACGVKPGCRLQSPAAAKELRNVEQDELSESSTV